MLEIQAYDAKERVWVSIGTERSLKKTPKQMCDYLKLCVLNAPEIAKYTATAVQQYRIIFDPK
jgi:hypothetical protein